MRFIKLILVGVAFVVCINCIHETLVTPSAQAQQTRKQASLSPPNVMAYVKRKPNFRLKQVSFAELPGWETDNHHEAFKAFILSCRKIIATRTGRSLGEARRPKHISKACELVSKFKKAPDRKTSKVFFETYFVPHKVNTSKKFGLLTGYYEPEILGSRTKTDKFKYPIYRKPKDHVQLRSRTGIGKKLGGLNAGRKTKSGIKPLPTREEIDKGALDGKKLELVYLSDIIDVFFLHIQGSGRIKLTDGSVIRVNFHARNGHPYSSIGKYMIRNKLVPKEGMSLDAVKNYLRKDLDRGQKILWANKSYIFFRELKVRESRLGGPLGAMSVALTPGRSLAVDTKYHELGMPIYVVSKNMKHHGENGFKRLMIAQDVGSAIKGTQRGDIFWGTGNKAGKIAGNTGNHGSYYILLPKQSLTF